MKRVSLVVVLMLFVSLASAVSASATTADPIPDGTFVVCGRGTSVGPKNCMTLQQAIDAATAITGTVTVDMLPGDYCPPTFPDMHNDYWNRLEFVGVGLAAYGPAGPPQGLTGPEAEMTRFKWDSDCGTAPRAFITLATPGGGTNDVGFRNLAFVGDGGSSWPTYGLDDDSVPVTVRDVIFKKLDVGLNYFGDGQMQVYGSAFHDNNVGINFVGVGSVDTSSMWNNTWGFAGDNFDVSMGGDTISQNTHGWSGDGSAHSSVVNTIVADNTSDCWDSGFESGGTFDGGGEGHNLVGSGCTHSADGDVVWTDGTHTQTPGLNGGPTPSIATPTQAAGHAEAGWCLAFDQREYHYDGGTCDIGAVQTAANGTPVATGDPAPGTLDIGTVPHGQTMTKQINVSNAGGAVLYTNGASISGAGFSINRDGCLYSVMISGQSCYVQVNASPPDDHSTITGTLKVKTSVGKLIYDLEATGGPPLLPPTDVHAVPGSKKATLNWTAPDNGGPEVSDYQISVSTDGGQNYSFEGYADSSPKTITGLDNGTTYEFEVASQDVDGQLSDWSAPSNAVTLHTGPDASGLSAPADATVDYGAGATVKGTLTDTDAGQPIDAATVNLLSRKSSSGTFSKVGTGTTDANGKVSVVVQPKVNAEYEWKYLGNADHHPATSAAGTIDVAQVVTAQLDKSSVKKGSAATVWGTVAPDETGQAVQLQKKVGSSWVTKATATIAKQKLPDGTTAKGFVLTTTPTSKGSVELRVRRASTASNATGLSAKLTLQVT